MITAVIFDMDGTLFDTERIYEQGWLHAGLKKEQYFQLIGRSRENITERLKSFGVDPAAARAKRDEYTKAVLAKGIPEKPGALDALIWLREHGKKTAIATSSAMSVAQDYLEKKNWGRYFDAVISGNTLKRGKPYPDIFLQAAEALGEDPANCLVAEDSFNGVRAGSSAGMVTVMVPDLLQPDEEIRSLCDAVLDSLEELPGWIEKREAEDEN